MSDASDQQPPDPQPSDRQPPDPQPSDPQPKRRGGPLSPSRSSKAAKAEAAQRRARKAAVEAATTKTVLVDPPARGGRWLTWCTLVTTAVFVLWALATVAAPSLRPAYAIYCSVLFAVGMAAFLLAIVLSGSRALQGTGVRASGLFLGAFAPEWDRRVFRWSFAVTCVVGLGVAIVVAGSDDPGPFVLNLPMTAFGILVPIWPPAVAGLHGARYCPWPRRVARTDGKGGGGGRTGPAGGRR